MMTAVAAVVAAELLKKEEIRPERDERYTYTWGALVTCGTHCEHKTAESKTMDSH